MPPASKSKAASVAINDAKSNYKSRVNIINGLFHHEDFLHATESFLTDAIAEKLKKASGTDHTFSVVSTFGLLDGRWVKLWISIRTGASIARLDLALAVDPYCVSHLFLHMINTSGAVKMPSACINAALCAHLCDGLWEHFGRRLEACPDIVSAEGVVDYSKLSYAVNTVEDGTNRLLSVMHIPSGDVAVVDEDIHIVWGVKWKLRATWSDTLACITNDKSAKFQFASMFANNKGPHVHPEMQSGGKFLKGMLERAESKLSSTGAAVGPGRSVELVSPKKLPPCVVVEAAKKKCSEEGLKKAREALKRKKVERDNSGSCLATDDKTVKKVKLHPTTGEPISITNALPLP